MSEGNLFLGGYAAAINQDGRVNSKSNSAPAGSIVSIYATGLGATTPSVPDGSLIIPPLPKQDLQVTVTVNVGVNENESQLEFANVDVLYAGTRAV